MKNPSTAFSIAFPLVALLFVPSLAVAMPVAGSNELRIDSSYLIPGYSITGLNHHSMGSSGTSNSTTSETLFGFGFAYGRFLTENLEIGTSLTMLYVTSGNTSATAPGFAPFIRAFAPIGDRVAFFGSVTTGLQYVTESSSSSTTSSPNITEWSAGVDAGLEFFPADSWSLRVGPTYRYIHEGLSSGGSSATVTDNIFGLNWAFAGYF